MNQKTAAESLLKDRIAGVVEKYSVAAEKKLEIVSFKPAVYLNGRLLGQFDKVLDILVSPSGKSYAYATRLDDFLHIYFSGNPTIDLPNKYTRVRLLDFSPDEKHVFLAASAKKSGWAPYSIYLDGDQLGETEAPIDFSPVRQQFAHAFSPDGQSVAWIKEVCAESGYSIQESQRLMINERAIWSMFGSGEWIRQMLWLKSGRLIVLQNRGDVAAFSFGQNYPDKLLAGDFVRIIAAPDNSDFAAIKKHSIGGDYNQYIVLYKNREYRLKKQTGDGIFGQTQIEFDNNKLTFLYPPDEEREIIRL